MELGLASNLRPESGERLVDRIEEAARAAETASLVSWWAFGEREVVASRSLDPTLGLQAVARATTTLRLGYSGELTSVQPAAVRAKQIASLDWFSGGRLEVGLDLAEPPAEVVDPVHADGDHLDRALDRLAAMRALWTSTRAAHDGPFVSFRGASALPKPVGARVPTLHVRAVDAPMLERVVASGLTVGGWLSWRTTPEQLAAQADVVEKVLGAAAGAVGRTWFVDLDDLAEAASTAREGTTRVDELVAVVDRVPTADDIDTIATNAR